MNETYFLVEQAVFLTNLTRRSENGRNEAALLDASEGATRADLDATLDWATRVETFDGGYDPLNLFFFPTSSGSFAVGRLTPAVPEAGEGAFYFQTFFVDEDAFFQCGANPIALLHWALNTARFALYRPGANLAAFRLEARAPWIDREELRRTTARLGTRALTTLIQTVLEAKQATFVADCNAFQVVSTLFDLTPIHWRPSLSFAVGVRFRDDRSFRLIGATAKRGVDASWRGESDAPCCDLRDVVENDDAYPIENDWAALIEFALKANRVDHLYACMAEDFCLRQANWEAGRGASSDEIAELGRDWRWRLEDEIYDEENVEAEENVEEAENLDVGNSFADDARDAENDEEEGTGDATDETEFFSGEFEGGWRDSDGDERWRVDATDAPRETGPASNERAAPKFIYKVVEPTEAERAAEESDREKGREKNATRKKNDNKGKGNASEARRGVGASLDEIFAGESFEDEWAATKRKDGNEGETNDANDASGDEREDDERPKNERGDASGREEPSGKEAALEALRLVFSGKKGVAGSNGKERVAIAWRCDEFLEFLQAERAFDEPLGLDGLTSLNALLDERGREALERLRRAAWRDAGKRGADESRTAERETRRLRLAPFAALSAEFPGWNEELRRFDALFDDACAGNDAAEEELRAFWFRWRRELDGETINRIRGAYEERLRGRLTAEDGGAVERMERLLAALAIYSALFLER